MIINVLLDINKKTNVPSGAATIQLAVGSDTNEAITKLTDKDFGGRPVRVVEMRKLRRTLSSSSQRYFGEDIECKCQACGQVGHRQTECNNPPLVPACHLCGGGNHEAGECKRLVKFLEFAVHCT